MTQCLVYLLRYLSEQSDGRLPWLSGLEDPNLAPALDLIFERPSAAHTVDSLADAATMSRSVFAERFRAAFGCTPIRFLHDVRLRLATELLGQRRWSVDRSGGSPGGFQEPEPLLAGIQGPFRHFASSLPGELAPSGGWLEGSVRLPSLQARANLGLETDRLRCPDSSQGGGPSLGVDSTAYDGLSKYRGFWSGVVAVTFRLVESRKCASSQGIDSGLLTGRFGQTFDPIRWRTID